MLPPALLLAASAPVPLLTQTRRAREPFTGRLPVSAPAPATRS
jgi:hypothetical protein